MTQSFIGLVRLPKKKRNQLCGGWKTCDLNSWPFPAFKKHDVSVLDFLTIFINVYDFLNIESICKQKQFLINMLYFTAKEIIKMNQKSILSFPKDKTISDIWTHVIKRVDFILKEFTTGNIFSIETLVNLVETLVIKVLLCSCNLQCMMANFP